MKILVTGAAGHMGSRLVPLMVEEGWQIIATDAKQGAVPGAIPGAVPGAGAVPIVVADLRDRQAVDGLCAGGIDALVHLANMGGWMDREPDLALNANMSICLNLFQASIKAGVKAIVYASSVHACCGLRPDSSTLTPQHPPYLPLDGRMPASAGSHYGLMKSLAEDMLRFHSQVHGLRTFALRLPWLLKEPGPARQWDPSVLPSVDKALASAWLSYHDAGRLTVACLKSDIPGHHVYLPASPRTRIGGSPRELIQIHYRDTPLKKPLDEIDALVDISAIEKEVGWQPTG